MSFNYGKHRKRGQHQSDAAENLHLQGKKELSYDERLSSQARKRLPEENIFIIPKVCNPYNSLSLSQNHPCLTPKLPYWLMKLPGFIEAVTESKYDDLYQGKLG